MSAKRKGWSEVKIENEIKSIIQEFLHLDYDVVSNICKEILSKYGENFDCNIESDVLYIKRINNINFEDIAYKKLLTEPKDLVEYSRKSINVVKRDVQVACNALINAGCKCELNSEHITFLRKKNGLPYTEPHHLVPLEYQKNIKIH